MCIRDRSRRVWSWFNYSGQKYTPWPQSWGLVQRVCYLWLTLLYPSVSQFVILTIEQLQWCNDTMLLLHGTKSSHHEKASIFKRLKVLAWNIVHVITLSTLRELRINLDCQWIVQSRSILSSLRVERMMVTCRVFQGQEGAENRSRLYRSS